MTTFYMAHFREPVFPFATKLSLAVFGGQDVAVSFASTAFSLLAVWFTYLLGSAVWSRPAGLLAALALSLDLDVVSLASFGWRDDAYVAAFTMCAYLMVRYARSVDDQPGAIYRLASWQVRKVHVDAALLGISAGLAILTRIMAVPFVLAGLAWIFIARRDRWREQAAGLSIAAVTAIVVAAPYFVNCWRVFGDPLYTFNVHGAIYSAAEGNRAFTGSTASYVRNKVVSRPIEVADTVAQGVTTYPFTNKFHGLNPWRDGIDRWLAAASLAGLIVFAGFSAGRLLLVGTLAALLPFSLTWTVDPDYRFTLFAYPMFLIAAAIAICAAVRVLLWERARPAEWRAFAWQPWTATVAAAIAVLWFIHAVSPAWVAAEALASGEDASVTVGERDSAWFGRGWSDIVVAGNVHSRVVTDEAVIHLRFPESAEYRATVRMDPFPLPAGSTTSRLPTIAFVLNGTPIATLPLGITPDRVGAYDIVLPASAVRRGANELVVRVERGPQPTAGSPLARPGLSDGDAASLWYLRLHPPPRAGARDGA
jgi:4-amino-4-deoxy-L-arabinose transferase-like glycosyltransferase